MSSLLIENLNFSFGHHKIIENLNLNIQKNEIHVFLGKSGIGKTTLLKLICGLEHPKSGRIFKDDRALNNDNVFIPPNKRNIGIVFQEDSLFHHLTVEQNIRIAQKKQNHKVFEDLLILCKIEEKRNHFPSELSGGQKQRVAIARALYQNPDIILFDEPFSALDTNLRAYLRQRVKHWLRLNKKSALFITHDKEEAIHLADKIHIINKGKISACGTPKEVLENPTSKEMANFLDAGILLTQKQAKELNNKNICTFQFEESMIFLPYSDLEITDEDGLGIHCVISDVRTTVKLDTDYFITFPGLPNEFGPFKVKENKKINVNEVAHLVLKNLSPRLVELQ